MHFIKRGIKRLEKKRQKNNRTLSSAVIENSEQFS